MINFMYDNILKNFFCKSQVLSTKDTYFEVDEIIESSNGSYYKVLSKEKNYNK